MSDTSHDEQVRALAASTAPLLDTLFPGFQARTLHTGGTTIHTLVGGQGPALLLLHGHPQTKACWHKVAPSLQNISRSC